jgi:hypothetical protein
VRASAVHSAAAAAPAREVEPRRTPVSTTEIREAIGRAHAKVTGRAASAATLDVLTAQASLETASGGRMYNYNFGGIKGSGPTGETAKLRTHEVLGGKDVEIRDGFRAYRTIDEGATDYVKLVKDRFPGAMAQAERGDVDGFARALKQSGYYTADEKSYAAGLRSLMGAPSAPAVERTNALPALPNTSSILGGASPAQGFADESQLSRVLDAIGHHREIIEPEDDE